MSPTIIDKNAEDLLYAFLLEAENNLQKKKGSFKNYCFLHCLFFQINVVPDPSVLMTILSRVEGLEDCALYVCRDGDVFVRWTASSPHLLPLLCNAFLETYRSDIEKYITADQFFIEYDVFSNDKLKRVCLRKMKKQTKTGKDLENYFTNKILLDTLKKTVFLTKSQRMRRTKPQFLIVEDQKFSQKILTSILGEYKCFVAESAAEALVGYIENCPDMVFLDIDLPDLNGHHFAKLVNNIDKDSQVVMVTANSYQEDVSKARMNNAVGFIAKPYEKEAILKIVEKFKHSRKQFAQNA